MGEGNGLGVGGLEVGLMDAYFMTAMLTGAVVLALYICCSVSLLVPMMHHTPSRTRAVIANLDFKRDVMASMVMEKGVVRDGHFCQDECILMLHLQMDFYSLPIHHTIQRCLRA